MTSTACVVPLRVRWAEVDLQGVVFNGHYLTYCDVCVTEYWRAIGMPYPAAFIDIGSDLFVRKATLEYHAPARYDDELEVCGRDVAPRHDQPRVRGRDVPP